MFVNEYKTCQGWGPTVVCSKVDYRPSTTEAHTKFFTLTKGEAFTTTGWHDKVSSDVGFFARISTQVFYILGALPRRFWGRHVFSCSRFYVGLAFVLPPPAYMNRLLALCWPSFRTLTIQWCVDSSYGVYMPVSIIALYNTVALAGQENHAGTAGDDQRSNESIYQQLYEE